MLIICNEDNEVAKVAAYLGSKGVSHNKLISSKFECELFIDLLLH